MDKLVIGVIEVMLLAAMKSEDYQMIALFPTARLVGYFAENWSFLDSHPIFIVPLDLELEEVFSNPSSQEAQDLVIPVLRDQIAAGKNKELVWSAKQACQSWLGFYKFAQSMI
jgi:hypothetical protein